MNATDKRAVWERSLQIFTATGDSYYHPLGTLVASRDMSVACMGTAEMKFEKNFARYCCLLTRLQVAASSYSSCVIETNATWQALQLTLASGDEWSPAPTMHLRTSAYSVRKDWDDMTEAEAEAEMTTSQKLWWPVATSMHRIETYDVMNNDDEDEQQQHVTAHCNNKYFAIIVLLA